MSCSHDIHLLRKVRGAPHALKGRKPGFVSPASRRGMILDIPSTPPEVAEPQPPPAFHVLEETHELELKLARGLVLQVAGQAEGAKHIQFSPTAPHRPAELIGSELRRVVESRLRLTCVSAALQVPAASSIASVIMRMYCVVEKPSSAASPAPTTSEVSRARAPSGWSELTFPLIAYNAAREQARYISRHLESDQHQSRPEE